MESECTTPEPLSQLLKDLIVGPDRRRGLGSYNKLRRSESIASDLIYSVSNFRIMPQKHVLLGMGLKTITNSRKAINILNKFGHSAGYDTVEEIETELSYIAASSNELTLSEIERSPYLNTGLAFNNFDRFIDTSTGKDTLHDTVGIVFQNIDSNICSALPTF